MNLVKAINLCRTKTTEHDNYEKLVYFQFKGHFFVQCTSDNNNHWMSMAKLRTFTHGNRANLKVRPKTLLEFYF